MASADAPWDVRILELIEAGVDLTIIDENLRRSPTERLRRLSQMIRFVEENRRRDGHREAP